jgi:putative Mg2+ transporter-C (MgtC) family protein
MELFNSLGYNIFLNLSLAVILGMIIGGERLYAHKTASMRTYAMVAMGAALFVTIAILGGQLLSSSYSSINPMYVVAQIISGIGFLGAGLIIFKDDRLTGVTSASGLWVCAGIGMACGFGLYAVALMATLLTLFVFIVLWSIEQKIKKLPGFRESDGENK